MRGMAGNRPAVVLVAVSLVVVVATGVAVAGPPTEGDEVHDFTLVDLAGVERTLSTQLGESPVVLVFFRGVW